MVSVLYVTTEPVLCESRFANGFTGSAGTESAQPQEEARGGGESVANALWLKRSILVAERGATLDQGAGQLGDGRLLAGEARWWLG